ncbi:uncharacterized protein LOC110679496 [Aedes aegypti]|uniref:Uncharacterized protein n=1 Tax=Aedes aegypti TaxID=7159 RepID=A0A6I8U289_AEDAE|nr:uncharacterized protein LOC110679496 [Aedes aegypti]
MSFIGKRSIITTYRHDQCLCLRDHADMCSDCFLVMFSTKTGQIFIENIGCIGVGDGIISKTVGLFCCQCNDLHAEDLPAENPRIPRITMQAISNKQDALQGYLLIVSLFTGSDFHGGN